MTLDPPRVVGRYEIVRELGRGGMATVHLARQPALDREVALKELHPAHAADATFARRFLHESRVGGAINHPSVVSVIEYFEHDGAPFIAMEYLERGSLRPHVGRLGLAQVAGVLESMLGGLAEAASLAIVHRDLKPENVLVTADGHAKVADFGIAKALGQVGMTEVHTAAGHVVGTPAYMAPEQVMGGELTPQTDLYATGVIAYELLCGRHPYADVDSPMALMLRHANDEPAPLAAVCPDLPPGVVAWVHAMLAKAPAARPASAAHAWDWLEGVVADELGARWRRGAALPEPGEPSRYVSVAMPVLSPQPPAPPVAESLIVAAEAPTAAVVEASPAVAIEPPAALASDTPSPAAPSCRPPLPPPSRGGPPPAAGSPSPPWARPWSSRPGRRGSPSRPATSRAPTPLRRRSRRGPTLEQRLRTELASPVRVGRQLTFELKSLVPGSTPDFALDRVDNALPATRRALAGAEVPAARSALRAQVSYLKVVRDTLKLETGDGQLDRLGGASARLVDRLERVDAAVPRASDSVGGARKLKAWAIAELAVPTAPDHHRRAHLHPRAARADDHAGRRP